MTVTVLAGTPLKVLNADLERLGLSLHNMGDIAEQTVAGAISTGTHGTGGVVAGLAAQVVGLELVTGTGEVLRTDADHDPGLLEVARVGLGALGVLLSVTLRVEPLFALRAVEQPMSWHQALDTFDEMAETSDHLDLYWFPHTDRVLAKRHDRPPGGPDGMAPVRPLPRWRAVLDDELMANTVFGALCAAANHAPRVIPSMNRVTARALGARSWSDVAHRVLTSERRVVFREMEYAVPREAGLDVLREVRRLLDASDVTVSFPVEVRVTPPDDVPLSTSYGRASLYVALHTHRGADHRPFFDLVEPALVAAGGRPHWGKLHTRTVDDLAPLYPRFADVLALRERLDPERVLTNTYLDTVLGR
jgi:L-gulonolactone oxidase